MKTKFILHGGYTQEQNDLNKGFFSEMVRDIPDGGTLLVVYFASDSDAWEEKREQERAWVRAVAGEKDIHVAVATTENFIEEVKAADVVYLRGGDTNKLKDILSGYDDFSTAVAGKTIAGSSAGAYVLATYYFTNSLNKVLEGFGLVPARVVCHHESTIHQASKNTDPIAAFEQFDQNLELILLKDYQWVVREVAS